MSLTNTSTSTLQHNIYFSVDIDPYYADKRTFMVLSKGGSIYRFSATKAMFLLSPFNPIRRIAITVLTNPFFSHAIILTILANCYVMVKTESEFTQSTETVRYPSRRCK